MSAERPIRNLKQLLADVEELRKQVIDTDIDKFDKLVNQSRERTITALNSFDRKSSAIPVQSN
jgi:hypothetical protein